MRLSLWDVINQLKKKGERSTRRVDQERDPPVPEGRRGQRRIRLSALPSSTDGPQTCRTLHLSSSSVILVSITTWVSCYVSNVRLDPMSWTVRKTARLPTCCRWPFCTVIQKDRKKTNKKNKKKTKIVESMWNRRLKGLYQRVPIWFKMTTAWNTNKGRRYTGPRWVYRTWFHRSITFINFFFCLLLLERKEFARWPRSNVLVDGNHIYFCEKQKHPTWM